MQTIPTLCATGSMVAAAGLGMVFGLPVEETAPGTPGISVMSPESKIDAAHTSPTAGRSSQTSLASNHAVRPTTAPSSHSSGDTRRGRQRKSWQKSDPVTAIDEASPSRYKSTPHVSSAPHGDSTSSRHAIPRRQSSSFLRRLSNLSFSASSSPANSEREGSRPMTSSSASTTPIFSLPPEESRLPRNKLVKRSLSQAHLKNGAEPSLRRRNTFGMDRPATSHKRLAAMSSGDRLPLNGPLRSTNRGSMSSEKRGTMSSYFRASVPKPPYPDAIGADGTPTGRRATRRILPDRSKAPVLSHPSSVAIVSRKDHVGLLSDDRDVSRGFSLQPSPTSSQLNSSSVTSSGAERSDWQPKSRRSLSISSFLNVASPSRPLSRRPKPREPRRFTSAPASSPFTAQTDERFEVASEEPSFEAPPKHRRLPSPHSDLPDTSLEAESPSGPSPFRSRIPTEPPSSLRTPPSNMSFSSRSRNSAGYSDLASSRPGSESDGKVFSSADEDEGRSDTAYDSMRTGATKSSSGYRGPALETLFDKDSPPSHAWESADGGTPSRFNRGALFASPATTKGQTIAEEESSTSTPGRTTTGPERRESRRSSEQDMLTDLPLSPPSRAKALSLGQLAWDSDLDDGGVAWSEHGDDPNRARQADFFSPSRDEAELQTDDALGSVRRKLKFADSSESNSEHDPRSNIFDWSEPAAIDRSLNDSPPARPRTVHGKKNPEAMGALSGARRAPSGLHTRSHSVPVLADLAGSRSTITNKFGTWGLGSKGVTEDWNDDFAFDEDPSDNPPGSSHDSRGGFEQGLTMIVPETIRAQQTSVLANIGLLKEWGLLIEELKELKNRAAALGIETHEFAETFDEVDAMIDLADQEVNDEGFPYHRSPTSSPGLLLNDEDLGSSTPVGITSRLHISGHGGPSTAQSTPKHSSVSRQSTPNSDRFRPKTRPRKDSEAVAQSVIEALQKRRQPAYLATPEQPSLKKIPFDTRTLRKIVPHVNGLVKRVKQIIREAEGLHWSRESSVHSPDPTLRHAFIADGSDETAEREQDDNRGLLLKMTAISVSD